MYKTFTFFSLFILFAVSLFSQGTNKFRTRTYDKYHIDSISELRNVDTWLALEMLDSLYRRCEENGFEECSLSKLESYRSEFYLSVSDHTNALKSSFIALRAKSKDPQSDLTWKLKSLRTISHEYIKTQNWFFAAKYLHELEDIDRKSVV